MFCIEWMVPPPWLPSRVAEILGAVLLVGGMMLVAWAAWQFRRHHTPILPYRRPEAIIETGPYRFTRNPIYGAQVLLLAGLASMFGPGWSVGIVPLFAVFMDATFVRTEERLMISVFGRRYGDYMTRVRRWI